LHYNLAIQDLQVPNSTPPPILIHKTFLSWIKNFDERKHSNFYFEATWDYGMKPKTHPEIEKVRKRFSYNIGWISLSMSPQRFETLWLEQCLSSVAWESYVTKRCG